MKIQSLYEVLGVGRTAPADVIKAAFRALAKQFHPDANPGDKIAEERFKEISAAYDILGDDKKRKQYDAGITASASPAIITTKTRKYILQEMASSGELADVYEIVDPGTGEIFALKVARSPGDNDLLANEAKVLKAVYPTDPSKHKFYMYLPKLLDSFTLDDGARRHASILEWLSSYYPLEKVRAAHPQLRMEHAVWMFNRVLEILGYVHNRKKYVHGAVLPSNVMVFASPEKKDYRNHGIRLMEWSYSAGVGETLKAFSAKYENFYPPEVFKKKPVSSATDIYMAAKSIIYTLGGEITSHGADLFPTHVPNYFLNFLKGCTLPSQTARPQDAWALHKELEEHMRNHYGPKKYVHFDMPLPT